MMRKTISTLSILFWVSLATSSYASDNWQVNIEVSPTQGVAHLPVSVQAVVTETIQTSTFSDLSGRWQFFYTDTGQDERDGGMVIATQTGNTLSIEGLCDFTFTLQISGSTVNRILYDGDTTNLTGTIFNDGSQISGTFSDPEDGETGTWRMVKESTATTLDPQGSLIMQGQICGVPIDFSSNKVCGFLDTYNGSLDDIEINSRYNDGWIGLELETPELLASQTTHAIGSFIVELEGTAIESCYGYEEIPASSGSVTIVSYTNNFIQGSFDLTFDGMTSLSGSFSSELK